MIQPRRRERVPSFARVTLAAAVRLGGPPEPARLAFDGATDAARFETYIGRCMVPALRPGDIPVVDDLSCR